MRVVALLPLIVVVLLTCFNAPVPDTPSVPVWIACAGAVCCACAGWRFFLPGHRSSYPWFGTAIIVAFVPFFACGMAAGVAHSGSSSSYEMRPVLQGAHASTVLLASLAFIAATRAFRAADDRGRGLARAALASAPAITVGVLAAACGVGVPAAPIVAASVAVCVLMSLAAFAGKPAPAAIVLLAASLLAMTGVAATATIFLLYQAEGPWTNVTGASTVAFIVTAGFGFVPWFVLRIGALHDQSRPASHMVGAFADPVVGIAADVS